MKSDILKSMRPIVFALVLGSLLVAGCGKKDEAASSNTSEPVPAGPPGAAPIAGAGTAGGVAPMTGGMAGGMTPMSGTDSVAGASGGSVGAAAKDMARRTAAGASGPAQPNPGAGGDAGEGGGEDTGG